MKTGNRLLDPEVHALVNSGSDGVLTFDGVSHVTDDEVRFEEPSVGGQRGVPLVLTGEPVDDGGDSREVKLDGTATFDDVHLPLPGFGNVTVNRRQSRGTTEVDARVLRAQTSTQASRSLATARMTCWLLHEPFGHPGTVHGAGCSTRCRAAIKSSTTGAMSSAGLRLAVDD